MGIRAKLKSASLAVGEGRRQGETRLGVVMSTDKQRVAKGCDTIM